ncbi:MAG: hypothetical protein ABI811_12975 [Acidobacteriota bacterium]
MNALEISAPTPSSVGALFSGTRKSRDAGATAAVTQPSAKQSAAQLGIFTTLLGDVAVPTTTAPALPSSLFLNLIRALGGFSEITEPTGDESIQTDSAESQTGSRFGTDTAQELIPAIPAITAPMADAAAPEQIAGALIRSMLSAKGAAQYVLVQPSAEPEPSAELKPSAEPEPSAASPIAAALPPSLAAMFTPIPELAALPVAPLASPNPPAEVPSPAVATNVATPLEMPVETRRLALAPPNTKGIDAPLAFALDLTPADVESTQPTAAFSTLGTTRGAASTSEAHLDASTLAPQPATSETVAQPAAHASPDASPEIPVQEHPSGNQQRQPSSESDASPAEPSHLREPREPHEKVAGVAQPEAHRVTFSLATNVAAPQSGAPPAKTAAQPAPLDMPSSLRAAEAQSALATEGKTTSNISSPAGEIAVRVAAPGSAPVDVRVATRAGEVHVEVRTSDANLGAALRQDLGALVENLHHIGYRAESSASQSSGDANPGNPSGSQQQQQQQQDSRNESGRQQHQRRPGTPTPWTETLSDETEETI